MDGFQIALPIVGVVAAAAVTFYAVSFAELREVLRFFLLPFSLSTPFQIISFLFHLQC